MHNAFTFNIDKPDMAVFANLRSTLQAYIKESPEWARLSAAGAIPAATDAAAPSGFDDQDEDIPFTTSCELASAKHRRLDRTEF